MGNPDRLHRRASAAAYLGISVDTLARWAVEGRGPRYRKPTGSRLVLYREADLIEFLGAPVGSTTEAAARDRDVAGVS